MTWTPPEAMVVRVARALAPKAWATQGIVGSDTRAQMARRVASMRHARAALAATPLAEFINALEDIANGDGQASPSNAMLELGPGEFHKQFVPLLQRVARNALARAKGETP
jgi:hypothetical protein